jgi:hypothetical protein
MYSVHDTLAGGFPHSEISGSTIARISPKLIAACHVLHRLLAPRHPPSALNSLSPTTRTPARRTINQPRSVQAPTRKSHVAGTHRCSTIQPYSKQPTRAGWPPISFTQTNPDSPVKTARPHPINTLLRCPTRPANRVFHGEVGSWDTLAGSTRGDAHNSLNYGDYRIRTDDPLLAKQVLYQLS